MARPNLIAHVKSRPEKRTPPPRAAALISSAGDAPIIRLWPLAYAVGSAATSENGWVLPAGTDCASRKARRAWSSSSSADSCWPAYSTRPAAGRARSDLPVRFETDRRDCDPVPDSFHDLRCIGFRRSRKEQPEDIDLDAPADILGTQVPFDELRQPSQRFRSLRLVRKIQDSAVIDIDQRDGGGSPCSASPAHLLAEAHEEEGVAIGRRLAVEHLDLDGRLARGARMAAPIPTPSAKPDQRQAPQRYSGVRLGRLVRWGCLRDQQPQAQRTGRGYSLERRARYPTVSQ